jgi:uncharacterized membrane protein YvlD (DUF360 family)
MNLSLSLLAEILLLSTAIVLTARLLPFISLRNYRCAILAGLMIALFNGMAYWVLFNLGVSIHPGSLTLVGLLINMVGIMAIDTLVSGFRVRHLWGAAVFALLITLVRIGMSEVMTAVV